MELFELFGLDVVVVVVISTCSMAVLPPRATPSLCGDVSGGCCCCELLLPEDVVEEEEEDDSSWRKVLKNCCLLSCEVAVLLPLPPQVGAAAESPLKVSPTAAGAAVLRPISRCSRGRCRW